MTAPGSAPAVAAGCTCPTVQTPQTDYPFWIIRQGCPTHDTFTTDTASPVAAPTYVDTPPETSVPVLPTFDATPSDMATPADDKPATPAVDPPVAGSLLHELGL